MSVADSKGGHDGRMHSLEAAAILRSTQDAAFGESVRSIFDEERQFLRDLIKEWQQSRRRVVS
jgi:hypothetical protein